MNLFRSMVRVGHNDRAFVENRRPDNGEDTVKVRSEGDMPCDAWSRHQVRRILPPGCL